MNGLCIRDLARITHGNLRLGDMPPLGGDMEPFGQIVTDSRLVTPGDVFWGLPGRFHDGSHFAEEAFLRGAKGVVIEGRRVAPWAGKFAVEVEDSNWALWQLGRAMRRRFAGRIIALTGDNSIDITREMIRLILSSAFSGVSHHIDPVDRTSLPVALLELNSKTDFAIYEMSLGPRGEIHTQSHLCEPQIGVITSLANSRMANRTLPPKLAEGKFELLSTLPRDGWAILNGDDTELRRLAKDVKTDVIWTGRSSNCDVIAHSVQHRNHELSFLIDDQKFTVPHVARHDLPAILAAYAVGRVMDLSQSEMAEAFAHFPGVHGNCEVIQHRGYSVINDTSHANLETTWAALDFLGDFHTNGRRIIVCGEIETAAEDLEKVSRNIGEVVVNRCGADWLFAVGPQADAMVNGARIAGLPQGRAVRCESMAEVTRIVSQLIEAEDVMLVKGKETTELQTLIDTLTQDDVAFRSVA